ncbi:nucleotidyltransferase family protein [Brachybacterium phenoliresistens]|uniref:nucleotidyltransferase family protein n=1 Tax=Brachybacterium phenoliresistens TaxID=396014 RepID=UPI000A064389|nr:nucleotidyltransferase family protein [Brachybacterium phenoliresistens]
MEPSTAQVPTLTRLRLAHGVLEHLAREAQVPILHVKGVALHPVLAEGRRPSTDCDLLVHPAHVDTLVPALVAAGWGQVTSFRHGSVFAHAATFHHPVWGTVDVHRSFPGLDRDPEETFALMWAGAHAVDLGGASCAVPDLLAQRLLLLVHAARDASGHARHDVRVCWTEADAAERERLDALAARLGATVPLVIATGRPELARGLPGEHIWSALHARADSRGIRRARWRDAAGVRERAALLLDAARVNPDHLALRLGHRPSRAEMRREWFDRLGRALRRR